MLTGNTVTAIVFGIIAIISLIYVFVSMRKNKGYLSLASNMFVAIGGISTFAFVIALSLNGLGFKYWVLEQHDDLTITSIDSRSAIADETKLTSEFAVEVDGIDGVLISEDPRFLSLDEGDTVNLSCHWVWQYGSADIHSCRIND